ncbi:MAG: hypothetical protein KBA31_03745 [Alphaproteobacteria bacterium]|nr:hypothetical protein [Alphaproteobacteria bacterium]
MSLEGLYFISQIIAAIAIVASLIFVGVQLRQAERTQRAAMHQARTQRGMDMALRSADAELVSALGYIIRRDPAATNDHFMQISGLLRAMILNLDDVAWQQKAGLLDQATLDNTVVPMQRVFSLPGLRALWQVTRTAYAPETAALVDRLIIANMPLAPTVDPISAWRTIAAQALEPFAAS